MGAVWQRARDKAHTAGMNDENTSLHSLDLGVGGMTCASCVARVERALKKVPGVQQAAVNLATESARVTYAASADAAALPALLRRAVRASQRALFREKLATLGLGLEARLTDRMGLLSGGQRQAVSLLMASLQPSRLLLLDEHTAALDPKTAAFVLRLTDQIVQSQGLTALMVTHSMRQALDHGTRTVMLHQGQVVLDVRGAERAALDVPDLLAMFSRVRGEAVDDDKLLLG